MTYCDNKVWTKMPTDETMASLPKESGKVKP